MPQLFLFALVNGFSLLLGSVLGLSGRFRQKTIAAFMAFGAGVLVCALTFGLMDEAFQKGGFDAVIIGFLLGGLIYIGSDYLIHVWGGRKHRRHQHKITSRAASGLMITLGAIMDGIPESIALGVTLFINQSVGFMLLAAIAISNFPEGVASARDLRLAGYGKKQIGKIWLIVSLVIILITVLAYWFLHDLDPNNIGLLQSLAAGAILAMLAANMMPEAYKEGGFMISALTVLGFLLTFVLSRL